jgi:hypothetical protein
LPKAVLAFELPDEENEFNRARLGSQAIVALWDIDQRCRSILKHGDPGPELRGTLEIIRAMIPPEMMEL